MRDKCWSTAPASKRLLHELKLPMLLQVQTALSRKKTGKSATYNTYTSTFSIMKFRQLSDRVYRAVRCCAVRTRVPVYFQAPSVKSAVLGMHGQLCQSRGICSLASTNSTLLSLPRIAPLCNCPRRSSALLSSLFYSQTPCLHLV